MPFIEIYAMPRLAWLWCHTTESRCDIAYCHFLMLLATPWLRCFDTLRFRHIGWAAATFSPLLPITPLIFSFRFRQIADACFFRLAAFADYFATLRRLMPLPLIRWFTPLIISRWCLPPLLILIRWCHCHAIYADEPIYFITLRHCWYFFLFFLWAAVAFHMPLPPLPLRCHYADFDTATPMPTEIISPFSLMD